MSQQFLTKNGFPGGGWTTEAFRSVAQVFRKNFEDGEELGASFVVYYKGRMVVDLWGGWEDEKKTKPYTGSSLNVVHSSGKAVMSMVICNAISKGYLSWDQKIADVWPEFGTGNKQNVTIKDLLEHQGGLTYLDSDYAPTAEETMNLDALERRIASQPHNFGGKLVKGYHGVTRGWFLNPLLRRVGPRKSHGELLKEWINPGLGIEVYCGIPEVALPRVNPVVESRLLKGTRAIALSVAQQQSVGNKGGLQQSFKVKLPPGVVQPANMKEVMLGQTPSAYTITNARGLAKLAAVMANRGTLDGFTLMDEKTWREAHTLEERNLNERGKLHFSFDHFVYWTSTQHVALGVKVRTTWAGWGLSYPNFVVPQTVVEFDEKDLSKPPKLAFKPHMRGQGWEWCGWFGYGGSVIQWEPTHNVAVGYVMNLMGSGTAGDARSAELCAEVVRIVNELEKKGKI
ncbi:beta-lactamase/transpeptidase-like protein [Gonapodya prolifera JEL478]|uniref:Beta-lactamase/transpeptidase-like protein n=1 Tax=Gonapodya prolifera (strain JEL478) TaxID=1344416 RepID=A0A139ATI7_GONPJ|nr:beta-lactamase/transpeptidase-like protein [Gonapodya prolifera JEL478]|eukprot:KXS20029.1 beta-lactamase/transpeptidase-like protein [Gonapodya prolifera JEL478]